MEPVPELYPSSALGDCVLKLCTLSAAGTKAAVRADREQGSLGSHCQGIVHIRPAQPQVAGSRPGSQGDAIKAKSDLVSSLLKSSHGFQPHSELKPMSSTAFETPPDLEGFEESHRLISGILFLLTPLQPRSAL